MKLVTLSGRSSMGEAPKFSLFSLSGTQMMKLDPRTLDNEDAGLYMLYWINKTYPKVTYNEIVEASKDGPTMHGIFGSIGKFIGGGVKKIGSITGSVIGYGARKIVKPIFSSLAPKDTLRKAQQGGLTPEDRQLLSQLGQQTKSNYSNQVLGMNPVWLIGGGVLTMGVIFLLTRRRR